MTRVTARSDEFPLDVDLMSVGQLERRGRLTTAVVEMLAEMPSDRIQMKDVSERSGVALGTLYRYFPTKQQLLAAAMTAWSGLESVRRPEKLRADGGENNAYERVLALHRREMKAFERRPYFARFGDRTPFVLGSVRDRVVGSARSGTSENAVRVDGRRPGRDGEGCGRGNRRHDVDGPCAVDQWPDRIRRGPAERRRRHRTGNSLNGCNLEFSSCFCCHERELSLRLCENEDAGRDLT